ncbi:MAG: WD40 repeat domain-containing protein [Isosphaeraceae bacterium]
MRNDPPPIDSPSTCRVDGVPERVRVGKTSSSLMDWKYPLAALPILAAMILCYYPRGTDSSASLGRSLRGHTQLLEAVTFSPDGQMLASSGWDSTVRLWDLSRWDAAHSPEPLILPHATIRYATAFAPDGSMLVSAGDCSLTIWSCHPEYRPKWERTGESYHSLSFSPDGRTLALGADDSTIRLWDMPSGRERTVLSGHAGTIRSLDFSPDGKLLVSASQKGRVVLWDALIGAEIRTLFDKENAPVISVAFSPDGRTIAFGEHVYTTRDVILLDVGTGAVRTRLTGHRAGVSDIAFSRDGLTLATAGVDYCIKLWDLATSKELATLREDVGWVKSIALSPDGARLAYCGSDEVVRFWDLKPIRSSALGREPVRRGKGSVNSGVEPNNPVAA